jgi:hypothetical protein
MHLIVVAALLLVAAAAPQQEKRYEVELAVIGAQDGAILAEPKVSTLENQAACVNIVSEHAGAAMRKILTTQSALPPEVADIGENPQTGITLAVKVERLDDKRVLLHLDVQYNEVRKAQKQDTQIVGNTLRAVKQVEVGKTVKFVLSSDSKGRTQRFVWATVKQHDDVGVKQGSVPPRMHELVPAPRVETR